MLAACLNYRKQNRLAALPFSQSIKIIANAQEIFHLTSADATNVRKSPSSIPEKVFVVVTVALPWVSVPVLSKITYFTFWALSRASPPFTSTPWLAPTPVATITAVGVARPRAHGQAITTTDMENMREKTKQLLVSADHEFGYAPSDPHKNLEKSIMHRMSLEHYLQY